MDACASGGVSLLFHAEIRASAVVTSYPPIFFLFLWTSGSQPDLIWSPCPSNLGKLGNVHRHFWLSLLVLSGSRPRMLLNIHKKELSSCKVSNTRIEKLCSRSLLLVPVISPSCFTAKQMSFVFPDSLLPSILQKHSQPF